MHGRCPRKQTFTIACDELTTINDLSRWPGCDHPSARGCVFTGHWHAAVAPGVGMSGRTRLYTRVKKRELSLEAEDEQHQHTPVLQMRDWGRTGE